jgi:hypothetical protein
MVAVTLVLPEVLSMVAAVRRNVASRDRIIFTSK